MELKSINREEQKIKDKRKKEGKNIIFGGLTLWLTTAAG